MISKRRIGNSNIEISVIGLGTVKFGRNLGVKYPSAFEIPDETFMKNFIAQAKSLGINCLDTAPAYGLSEERLGHVLKNERHDWVVISKAGEYFNEGLSHYDFTPESILRSVENSLRQLQTDFIDVLLIHSNGEDMNIIERFDVFDTLDTLKRQGKIRLGGMSTKTVEGGLATVAHSDVVMLMYHPEYRDEESIIDAAFLQKKGVFIKKVFNSGHLLNAAEPNHALHETLDFVLNKEGVTSAILGTINPKHLMDNVNTAIQVVRSS